jgi:hypothetical protein
VRRETRTPTGSNGRPIASYSGSFQPAPKAMSSRPSDSTSSEASSWASTAGWRRSLLKTNDEIRSRLVAAAITAIAGTGASWGMRWSGTTSPA